MGTYIIATYFAVHGILYLLQSYLMGIFGVWNKYLSVVFGNVTFSDITFVLPFIIGFAYIIVAYGLLANEHWARIGLLILCIQGIFFEFPIGLFLYIPILVYSFSKPFSKTFPKKTAKASYQITGFIIIVASVVALLILTGVSQGIIAFSTYKVQGYPVSYDSPESKFSTIDQRIGVMDVLIEFTGTPDMALQQQDMVITEIAPYIRTIKNRFYEASNAMIVTIEATDLLEIAENQYITKIYPVEPSFRFLPYTIHEATVQQTTAHLQMQVENLWSQGLTGQGITVAVMDTGIKEDHPDLQRNGESIVVGSLHLHGEYVHEHGTMVASCIASQDETVKGIAPNVNLLNIEVFHWETIGGVQYLTATNADILQGFEFVANWKELTGDFVILSCSWGVSAQSWQHDADVCTESANRLAVQYNIPVVASAGNSGPATKPYTSVPYQIMSPAGGKHVLAVGAVDSTNNIAGFSSLGPYYNGLKKPDVVAPGVSVPVLTPTGTITAVSGTSFACPYVSGLMALLAQQNTDVSSDQLYNAIKRGAEDLGTAGYDYEYGYGIASGEGSNSFITQAVPQLYLVLLFISTIGIGIIIIAYPQINRKLQKH